MYIVRSGLQRSYDSLAKPQNSHVIFCVGSLFLLGSTTWLSISPWQQPAMHDGSRRSGRSLLGLDTTICKVVFLGTNECFFYVSIKVVQTYSQTYYRGLTSSRREYYIFSMKIQIKFLAIKNFSVNETKSGQPNKCLFSLTCRE